MTGKDRWLLPEGIEELLPAEAAVAERVRRNILDLFRSWGYQFVMPPLVEFTDSLLIGLGEDVALQSFRLTDQLSGKPMAIRADITPQTARIDAHSMRATGVNRLCYAGSVLYTRPQALRGSRCPIQAGAELYGDASTNGDIEIISLMLDMLENVMNGSVIDGKAVQAAGSAHSLQGLTLDLGHVGIYSAAVSAMRSLQPDLEDTVLAQFNNAMQRKSAPDLRALTALHFNDTAFVEALCALPLLCGGREVLQEARALMPALSLPSGAAIQDFERALRELETVADAIAPRFPDVDIYFDLTELRGFSYHTGLVFAAYSAGHGTALANGGRYDEVGKVFGAARPATGFNTDVKALIRCVHAAHVANAAGAPKPALCDEAIAAPKTGDAALWRKVCDLRRSGEIVVAVDDSDLPRYRRRLLAAKGSWVVQAHTLKNS